MISHYRYDNNTLYYCKASAIPVIFLDWTGVDLSSNPLHPASKLFDSKSSLDLQYIYILKIERFGVSMLL